MPRINGVIEIDREELQRLFSYLNTDEHKGDVADTIVMFVKQFFGFEPEYDDSRDTFVFPWDEQEEED